MNDEVVDEEIDSHEEYKLDEKLAFIDRELVLSAQRDIYDEKEIYEIVERLTAFKAPYPEITEPVVDWSRNRTYTSSEKVMNMLLDIRKIEYPYDNAGTEDEI